MLWGREECFLVTTCISVHHGHDHTDASSASSPRTQRCLTTTTTTPLTPPSPPLSLLPASKCLEQRAMQVRHRSHSYSRATRAKVNMYKVSDLKRVRYWMKSMKKC